MSTEDTKRKIGYKAADFIQDDMLVGLGTGTTSHYFIEALIQKKKEGLKFLAVATSKASHEMAQKGGLSLVDINTITHLDITVDGADEVDEKKRMIKGAGGALLREKIIASISREMIVIVDESKIVQNLGKRDLPVEITPFAYKVTKHQLQRLGYSGKWRVNGDDSLFVTDNGNYILDIHFDALRQKPEEDDQKIRKIPGVIETGFFFNLAKKIVIGMNDGRVIIKE